MPLTLNGSSRDIAGLRSVNSGGFSFRNKLINGNPLINQEVKSGSSAAYAAGVYFLDGWKAGAGGATLSFATVNNVTTITVTAGTIVQVIEGLNLRSGPHVLSWVGSATGRIDAGLYGTSGNVTATLVGGTNAQVEFGTGTVSAVQLEYGTVPTWFEDRPFGLELALCQRYYEKSYAYETAPGTATNVGMWYWMGATDGSANAGPILTFRVTKRAVPTLTPYSQGAVAGFWTIATSGGATTATPVTTFLGPSGGLVYCGGFGTSVWTPATVVGHWTAAARL